MSRSGVTLCDDILRSISLISQHLNGAPQQQFLNDPKLRDAVYYRVAVIGEAAGKLRKYSSEIAQVSTPAYDLDRKLKLFNTSRNKLIHAHWTASPSLVLNTLRIEIGSLGAAIQQLRALV